jgi:hypothetical protein
MLSRTIRSPTRAAAIPTGASRRRDSTRPATGSTMTRVEPSSELPATTASRRGPSQASAWGASATIPKSTVATRRSRTGSTRCTLSSSISPSTSSDRSGDQAYPEIP